MDHESAQDRRESPQEPAGGGRLLLGWALIGLALVLLIAGWYGLSGEPMVAAQLSYMLSGGFGGLVCGILGVGMLISNDIRRDRDRLGRVEAALLEVRELVAAQTEYLQSLRAEDAPVNGSEPARPQARKAKGR